MNAITTEIQARSSAGFTRGTCRVLQLDRRPGDRGIHCVFADTAFWRCG